MFRVLCPYLNLCSGLAAHYLSWRILQLLVGMLALATFVFMFLFFPETYHQGERGIDKLAPSLHPTWRPVLINPLRPLLLLRSLNFFFVVGLFSLPKCLCV